MTQTDLCTVSVHCDNSHGTCSKYQGYIISYHIISLLFKCTMCQGTLGPHCPMQHCDTNVIVNKYIQLLEGGLTGLRCTTDQTMVPVLNLEAGCYNGIHLYKK